MGVAKGEGVAGDGLRRAPATPAMAALALRGGMLEGRRAEALEYTDRVVITQKDFWVQIRTEIARVKSLSGDGAPDAKIECCAAMADRASGRRA